MTTWNLSASNKPTSLKSFDAIYSPLSSSAYTLNVSTATIPTQSFYEEILTRENEEKRVLNDENECG